MIEKNPKFIVKPRLRELLSKSKFKNQKEFAEIVGVKEPTISRFDSQTRYDIVTLVAISRALGVSIDDLFVVAEQQFLFDLTDETNTE
jgi:transcriptional regulator with XRE-family HTH domain